MAFLLLCHSINYNLITGIASHPFFSHNINTTWPTNERITFFVRPSEDEETKAGSLVRTTTTNYISCSRTNCGCVVCRTIMRSAIKTGRRRLLLCALNIIPPFILCGCCFNVTRTSLNLLHTHEMILWLTPADTVSKSLTPSHDPHVRSTAFTWSCSSRTPPPLRNLSNEKMICVYYTDLSSLASSHNHPHHESYHSSSSSSTSASAPHRQAHSTDKLRRTRKRGTGGKRNIKSSI